jgi:hypothetical protein
MLLTIPRENYEDVKVEYLTRGRVDMSKCVMFIDRMLDSTDFPNKSMRGMYIRYFKPYIESLGVNIAKVPAEYILDKCFHTTDIKITEKSIVEKKKKIDEVVEQFLRGVKAPSLPEGAGSFTIENMQQAIGNIYGQHRTPVYNVGIDPSRIGDVHISTPISLDGSQGLESYIQDNPIRIYTSEEVQRIFNEPLESRYNGAEHVQAPEVRVPIRRRPPNPIPPVEPQGWSMEEMERIVEEMRTS